MALPTVKRLSWQQRVTNAFVQLSDTLVIDFDVVEFLQTVLVRSVELLAADDGGLMLADADGHLKVMTATTDGVRLMELFELQAAEGPCVDCFRTGEQVLNVDPDGMVANWPRFGPIAAAAGYRYVHALPLHYRGQVLGAMNLFCSDKNPFSPDGIALGQGLADIATIGLLQQRRNHERLSLTEQLQTAWSTRVVIEQAKGVLAERHQTSLDDAFTTMRRQARNERRPLTAIARIVLEIDAGFVTQLLPPG